MNKKQKILILVLILILEIVLLVGAFFSSQSSDYYLLDPGLFFKDFRIYLAILIAGIGGYFLLSRRKND